MQGNEHACRMLVQKYQSYLYKTAYSVLRNEKDAEDAVQEAMLKILTSLPKYNGSGFKTWITRITLNQAIDVKRKRDRRQEYSAEEIERKPDIKGDTDVERQLLQKEKQRIVRERLNELPENYRHVVYGYYILGKSFQQLAEAENIKEKSAKVRLHRARLWMKKHWKEEDF
jgi:RNA polymerase sigma factor (sigma-70 family)